MEPSPSWLRDLRRLLGDRVVDDPDVVDRYAVDWTGRFRGEPACVVRPATVDDVLAVMRFSAEDAFPVVPQGGNTGLVGATQAPAGSVILNLESLRGVRDVDGPSLVASAGTTIADVGSLARAGGYGFGLDMASRHSATVGGAFNTNAGGLYACRFGRMADQVTGLEAVLADGTVLSTIEGSARAIAGTDPTPLFAGSEGTLAVVTAIRVALHSPLGPTVVVLAGFDDFGSILDLLAAASPLLAAEVFGRPELELVARRTGRQPPLPWRRWYLLAEVEQEQAAHVAFPPDALVGSDLWEYRDRITECLASTGVVHKHDVVVPRDRLPILVESLTAALAPHRLFVFGHVLMDDFHLNVAPPTPEEVVSDTVDGIVYSAVEDVGGAIAGEHGVGRLKRDRHLASLPATMVRLARALKEALDPDGRLNPGVGV